MARKRAAVLISGRGSNMVALIEAATAADYPAEIAVVVSNDPQAKGLDFAKSAGIPTAVVDHKPFGKNREAFERALQSELEKHRIEIVVLAGFMRILTAWFVSQWDGRMINIHPALLPAFDMPLPIDPQKDLAPVAQLADIPCVLAVNSANPAKTFPEFLEWVKAQPGPVHYSTSSAGGLPHLWGELIATRTNGKLQHIPYKAAAEALRDAVAGHVPAFLFPATETQHRVSTLNQVGFPQIQS